MPTKPLPEITLAQFKAAKSQADVAAALRVSSQWLGQSLWPNKVFPYRLFTIPKRSGGTRTIEVPHWRVKLLQHRLLPYLVSCYAPKDSVHGFVNDRDIVTNAERHVGRALVLNLDLLEFFPSIHFGRVRGMFMAEPFNFNNEVASTLSRICTRPISVSHAVLPQGAPTSPAISNLICRRLDIQLARLATRYRCRYTRYADDITFSTMASDFPVQILESADAYGRSVRLGHGVLSILNVNGFAENPFKSRLQTPADRQAVTGLIVNRRVNVPREFVRQIRAIICSWRKGGYAAAEAKFHSVDASNRTRAGGPPSLAMHLSGKLEYLRMVRGRGDVVFTRYALQAAGLPSSRLVADVEGNAAWMPEFIRPTLWIVRGLDNAGNELYQGTAFMLRGVGFVTARHVVEVPVVASRRKKKTAKTAIKGKTRASVAKGLKADKLENVPAAKWELVRGSPPFDCYPITGYRADTHPPLDIAILETGAQPRAQLLRGRYRRVNRAETILIEGFPQWNSAADEPDHVSQTVRQVKTVSMVSLFSINANLHGGLSGAPVLDTQGHVIGVVAYGNDGAILANSAVDLEHLDRVRATSVRPLPAP
jgi:RNA-directed DNA polymerase